MKRPYSARKHAAHVEGAMRRRGHFNGRHQGFIGVMRDDAVACIARALRKAYERGYTDCRDGRGPAA